MSPVKGFIGDWVVCPEVPLRFTLGYNSITSPRFRLLAKIARRAKSDSDGFGVPQARRPSLWFQSPQSPSRATHVISGLSGLKSPSKSDTGRNRYVLFWNVMLRGINPTPIIRDLFESAVIFYFHQAYYVDSVLLKACLPLSTVCNHTGLNVFLCARYEGVSLRYTPIAIECRPLGFEDVIRQESMCRDRNLRDLLESVRTIRN